MARTQCRLHSFHRCGAMHASSDRKPGNHSSSSACARQMSCRIRCCFVYHERHLLSPGAFNCREMLHVVEPRTRSVREHEYTIAVTAIFSTHCLDQGGRFEGRDGNLPTQIQVVPGARPRHLTSTHMWLLGSAETMSLGLNLQHKMVPGAFEGYILLSKSTGLDGDAVIYR